MNEMSGKSRMIITFLIVISLIFAAISWYAVSSMNNSEKKLVNLAKEIEELKLEIKEIKRSGSEVNGEGLASGAVVLQKKLNKMREEIDTLKKNGGAKALEDYKKEKHEFWMDYAEEVKRSWTSFLQNALVEKGIPAEDIELIKYDYNVMLDKIRDEQLRWYDSDAPVDELNETVKGYAREFFDDMSENVGERKASITLGIVFPDQLYRKSLFEEEK